MTNNINFLDNIDAIYSMRDSLDDMLDFANTNDMIPNEIDHFYDDCHAAPDAYIPASTLFRKTNNIDDNDLELLDFYEKLESDDLKLSFRMMLESLRAELSDAKMNIDEYTAKLDALLK